jgi:flagellar M-ring protein FliF
MKKILLICLLILACGDEPRMATLYADLDTPAMADFTAFLRENKYEYKLEKSDSTISVPKHKLYEIRMNLAKIGLLKGKTYILFDKETERNHHNSINYIRVIQSELARSIETLSEVEKARIYIKMKDTTAVVTVKLHPNQELQERRIKAIQHLVASAVNELKAERVSIIYDKEDKPTEDPDCCQDEVFR